MGTVGEEAEEVPAEGEVQGKDSTDGAKDGQGKFRQVPEYECVENVSNVFQHQGPGGSVEGVQFIPSADVEFRSARDEEEAHDQAEEEFPSGGFGDFREGSVCKEEQAGSNQCTDDQHRMQTGQAAFEEAPGGHPVPAVIVGVSYDET